MLHLWECDRGTTRGGFWVWACAFITDSETESNLGPVYRGPSYCLLWPGASYYHRLETERQTKWEGPPPSGLLLSYSVGRYMQHSQWSQVTFGFVSQQQPSFWFYKAVKNIGPQRTQASSAIHLNWSTSQYYCHVSQDQPNQDRSVSNQDFRDKGRVKRSVHRLEGIPDNSLNPNRHDLDLDLRPSK